MPYEWLVGYRYLAATRSSGAPSVITVISAVAVAVGVAALILVLAVLGGFEGDLRTKILGTKAHLLLTGPAQAPLEGVEEVARIAADQRGVVGVSPFVESDVMIASVSNYSGIVLRGVEPERLRSTTSMDQYVTAGAIDWLLDPEAARASASMDERSELDRAVRALQDELDALETERAALAALLEGTVASTSDDEYGTGGDAAETEAVSPNAVGPPSLEERLAASPAPPGADEATGGIPGILIGSELSASLHVEVGDQVQIINPDGDDGPTGPIPRAWPYRVVGVFHTGLYEFDSSMVYMHLPEARRFLDVDAGEVTGLEVRLSEMDTAREQAVRLEAAIGAAGRDDVEVATWMQLNERLFSALMLEQLVIGLLLMIIVLVASFAIVCVLIMIVIQRGDEIAILRAMGASSKGIRRVFVIQGMCIGLAGTLGGLALGLGLVGYLVWVGFPLEPSVYYIDRVPVELSWREVIAVAAGALGISAVATLLPSMQAARLDPAAALRHD